MKYEAYYYKCILNVRSKQPSSIYIIYSVICNTCEMLKKTQGLVLVLFLDNIIAA